MRKSIWVRFIAMLLVVALAGCGGGESTEGVEVELTEEQLNSIRMLNYLTVLSQEIYASNNSQLFLETAYSSLINNTYPDAVDVRTKAHLEDLLDTLESFKMLGVKRDRLQYIYEKNKAKALQQAIPSPISALNVVEAGNVLKTAVSVVYMAADAYTSYTEYMDEVETQYLQDGWVLDDAEAAEVHNTRTMAFSYMLDMVRNNGIPGDYTLNETTVADFVSWKNNSNITRRIHFFESNKETYQMFGDYWLTLASSYYENGDYVKCMDAVAEYEKIDSRVFRKDYGYAKILPLVIVSAREACSEVAYIATATKYLSQIIANADNDDWAMSYFVAQTYVDLYQKTEDTSFLREAYDVMVDAVNILIDEQQSLNATYMAEIAKTVPAKDATKKQKDEAEQYNKMLVESRKKELPPISEPLRTCGELLFAIADELNISDSDKEKLEKMLHEGGADLFYNLILDDQFRFSSDDTDLAISDLPFEFDGGSIQIPVILVTQNSRVKVSAVGENKTTEFEEWKLKKVERKNDNVESFVATYASGKAEDFDYEDGMSIIIEIYSSQDALTPAYTVEYKAVEETTLWVFDSIYFERVS